MSKHCIFFLLFLSITLCQQRTGSLQQKKPPHSGAFRKSVLLTAFNTIVIEGPIYVVMVQSSRSRLTIQSSQQSLLSKVLIRKSPNTLFIIFNNTTPDIPLADIRLVISFTNLTWMSLGNSADVSLDTFYDSREVSLNVTGTSSLNIKEIIVGSLNVYVDSVSKVIIAGNASKLFAQVKEVSSLQAGKFFVNDAKISADQVSKVDVQVRDNLSVAATNMSTVTIKGNPKTQKYLDSVSQLLFI